MSGKNRVNPAQAIGVYYASPPTITDGDTGEFLLDTAGRLVVSAAGDGDLIAITPTCDTNIYASGDLLFDLTAVANAVRSNGDVAYIKSLTVIDKDAQGTAMDIYVSTGSTTMGTLNSAPNISDANIVANQMQLLCQIATSDYATLSGAKIASLEISKAVEAAAGTRSIYIGAVTQGGTPTYTASGLVLLVGLIWK